MNIFVSCCDVRKRKGYRVLLLLLHDDEFSRWRENNAQDVNM
jgi:hypothetical protein